MLRILKLVIVGSAHYRDFSVVESYLNNLLSLVPRFELVSCTLSGYSRSFDSFVEHWSSSHHLPLEVLKPLTFSSPLDSLFRDSAFLSSVDVVAIFWSGVDGSNFVLSSCQSCSLPYALFEIPPPLPPPLPPRRSSLPSPSLCAHLGSDSTCTLESSPFECPFNVPSDCKNFRSVSR